MYRLLSLRKMRIGQINGMTIHNIERISKLNVTERTCTLCKQSCSNALTLNRYQSTHTNPNMKPPRKKRLRGVKKYAELLVVTENSTTQHKAKIMKFTSEDLNFLTLTNLNLSELYKLEEMMKSNKTFEEHTYNNLTVIENIPFVESATSSAVEEPKQTVIESSINSEINDIPGFSSIDGNDRLKVILPSDPECSENKDLEDSHQKSIVLDDIEPVKEILSSDPECSENKLLEDSHQKSTVLDDIEPFQEVLPSSTQFQPEVLDEEPHETAEPEPEDNLVKDQKTNKIDLQARHEIITKTLAAYIEMCSILKQPHRGLNALTAYHFKSSRSHQFPALMSINVYNAALKGFASAGNFPKLQEIIMFANRAQVTFNVQSYVAIFECLGRCNINSSHLREIRIYGKEARWTGFSFDRILDEGIFLKDEREQVLKAMVAYNRYYIPTYIPPNIQYNNNLLNHLNKDEQLKYKQKTMKTSTGIFQQDKMHKMIDGQIQIEKQGYVTVRNIDNKAEPTPEILKYREAFDEHTKMWEDAALQAFNRDLISLSAKKQTNKVEPFMKSIPIKDFINIIISEAKLIAQGSETYSPTAYLLYRELGLKVYSRFKVLRKKKTGVLDKIYKTHKKYCEAYVASHGELKVLPTTVESINTRQIWQLIELNEKSNGASIELDHQPWVPSVLQSVGKFLYNIIMHDLKVDANVMKGNSKNPNYVPAFYTIFRHHGRIIKEEVKPHPVLSKLYRASSPETLSFPAVAVPMKCPPIPWSSLNTGGYLVTNTEFVRLPSQAMAQKQRLKEADLNQLYPSFDALNQLAAVPWKVNKNILDCILRVFTEGGSSKLCVPEHPSSLPPPVPLTSEMDKQQKFLFFRQKLQHRRKKAEMYSLWCDCLYRLSLANHFKDDIFWLPHNMDFRGRVYPIPPHLNHLGSDLARSMLVFAEARPLGPKGLDWLKLHLINLTGSKKREPIANRLDFANEIMDKILDSADNPLTGNMWWASSDEPWQTLACCMEIAEAVRSPDPAKYKSHFPVHQDGSCNGLQHYAALGRDSAGGYSVNLTPARKPQDVYSSVAALVEERRQRDADSGIEIAKTLKGFVRRKVIKQTVMTTVYGVTRYGARLQIARQLKDIDEFPKESVWAASSYLTARTFESLRTMFTSTREIQDWFTECARLISSVCGENVEWVTPLGLPIVQPYFRYRSPPTNSLFESYLMDKYEKPNVMKQKNAFPPNFIHSLDSSHMMLTSLHCERAGITFVSVHDCYWTHPSTVHIMNKICREQFVALHSEPILESLSIFLSNKYSYNSKEFRCDGSAGDLAKRKLNKVLRKLPNTGDFNIEQVLNSVYFFS